MPATTQSTLCPNCSGAQWLLTHTAVVAVMWPVRHAASHQCDSCAVISVWTDTFLCLNPFEVLPTLHRRVPGRNLYTHWTVSHARAELLRGDMVPNRHLQCRIEHKRVSALHLYGNQQEILQVKQEVALPAFLQERGPKLSDQEGKSTLLWLRGPFSYYLSKYPGTVIYH